MKKNMGSSDKTLRIALAIIMITLVATDVVSGVLGYVLLGASIVFALTSFISFCPLYTLLGIDTIAKNKE